SSMSGAHCARTDFDIFAYPYPGRSARMNLDMTASSVVTENRFTARVFPGVLLTLASPFRCSSELIREDLPTFERPTTANSGKSPRGNCSAATQLLINSAVRTFMER